MPDARMIIRADGTQIFCNETGGQTQCFEMSGQAPSGAMSAATPFLGLATSFQEGVDDFPGFANVGEREIAGRTARCGRFDPSQLATSQQAGEATLCLDTETGVMLSYEATSPQGPGPASPPPTSASPSPATSSHQPSPGGWTR